MINQSSAGRLIWVVLVLSALPAASLAQPRELDPERTESWAMAHTTVATLFQGLAPPQNTRAGQITFAAELVSIPHVSTADSFVGFNGTKFEDLNKSPVFGRGRLRIGLPWQLTAELAYTPALEIDGAKPDGIYGLAIERPLWSSERWRLGARAFGQAGHAEGDITCPQSVVDFGPDDFDNNPFGCLEASNDDIELDHYGVEFSAAYALDNRWSLTGALAATRLEPEVQVDAQLRDGPDQSQLATETTVYTSALGALFRLDDRWRLSGSVNYTPLHVRRPPDRDRDNDYSLNLRFAVEYAFTGF